MNVGVKFWRGSTLPFRVQGRPWAEWPAGPVHKVQSWAETFLTLSPWVLKQSQSVGDGAKESHAEHLISALHISVPEDCDPHELFETQLTHAMEVKNPLMP